jgi:hypothetical protein
MKILKISHFNLEKDLQISGYDPFEVKTLRDLDIAVQTGREGRVTVDSIPCDTESDFASIPKWLQPIIGEPSHKPFVLASIVHDWHCLSQTRKQSYAHSVFREMLKLAGVPFWKRQLMFLAVSFYCRKKYPKWK